MLNDNQPENTPSLPLTAFDMAHTYPETTKLISHSDDMNMLAVFLMSMKYVLAREVTNEAGELVLEPVEVPLDELVASFFDIDLQKIELEKADMLMRMSQLKFTPGATDPRNHTHHYVPVVDGYNRSTSEPQYILMCQCGDRP